MELKVYIGFGVRGCYVVNPFNGIESEPRHVRGGPRSRPYGIHSMELKVVWILYVYGVGSGI